MTFGVNAPQEIPFPLGYIFVYSKYLNQVLIYEYISDIELM